MNKADFSWIEIIRRYSKPDPVQSWWQLVNTIVPYILLWFLMVKSIAISYWITLFLSVFAAGFLVRIFIIFHDCGHGSFFSSKKLSTVIGTITGLMVFTPYHRWHYDHQVHHETVGNLDRRGIGDVPTLTVSEFNNLSRWQKLNYRILRNPVILIGIVPFLLFTIQYRLTRKDMSRKVKLWVHLTNLGLAILVALMMWLIGWKTFLLIQVPVLYIASVHGVWLFYVQHQYKDVKWVRKEKWDYKTIALEGSSMFKLPRILQWFTGNIGFHHVHHLGPRIPNYKLEKCYNENPIFRQLKPITFYSAFESLFLRLWDEKSGRMVKFSEI